MACFANSPGRMSRTAVWISRYEMVDFFEYEVNSVTKSQHAFFAARDNWDILDASVAIRSKMSLTKEFRIAIALLEIPVSGWTCLRTAYTNLTQSSLSYTKERLDAPL